MIMNATISYLYKTIRMKLAQTFTTYILRVASIQLFSNLKVAATLSKVFK
jgi:hypothetical protein